MTSPTVDELMAILERKDAALRRALAFTNRYGSKQSLRAGLKLEAALALTPTTVQARVAATAKVVEAVMRWRGDIRGLSPVLGTSGAMTHLGNSLVAIANAADALAALAGETR